MRGDIVQDQTGWLFRDNGDGTYDNLSATDTPTVTATAMKGSTVVLVRDGATTGNGDSMAARVAVVLAKRYAVAV